MNNERMTFLIAYLDGLTTLTANEFRCNTEIGECIKAIREELAIEPSVKVWVENGETKMLGRLR